MYICLNNVVMLGQTQVSARYVSLYESSAGRLRPLRQPKTRSTARGALLTLTVYMVEIASPTVHFYFLGHN